MTEPLLNPRQVADILNVSDHWVRIHGQTLGGIRVGKMWRFHPDRIAYIARHGTIPDAWPPPESPVSPPPSAPPEVASGQSDGENTGAAAKNAVMQAKRKRKTQRPASDSAFARDFPEFANG